MPWWMRWRLYKLSEEVSGGLFRGIWFVLKWTIFLMPTIIIKMTKIMILYIMPMCLYITGLLISFGVYMLFVIMSAILKAISSKEN